VVTVVVEAAPAGNPGPVVRGVWRMQGPGQTRVFDHTVCPGFFGCVFFEPLKPRWGIRREE
jgi:hypothetical protein